MYFVKLLPTLVTIFTSVFGIGIWITKTIQKIPLEMKIDLQAALEKQMDKIEAKFASGEAAFKELRTADIDTNKELSDQKHKNSSTRGAVRAVLGGLKEVVDDIKVIKHKSNNQDMVLADLQRRTSERQYKNTDYK